MNQNIENREKEIFEERQAKQAKLAKRLLLGIFSGFGFIFSIVGAVFLILDGFQEIGIIFLPFGLIMIALGVILFFAIPTKYNYEKYKARVEKYGYINAFAMASKIAELEARIEELEKKNKN